AVVRPHPIYVCLSPLIFCFSNAECLMKALASCCCALLLVGVASSVAKGDFVTSVTIENVSSELGAPIFDRGAGYLLSDVGLDVVTGTHSIIPDGTMWLTNGSFREPFDPLPAQV